MERRWRSLLTLELSALPETLKRELQWCLIPEDASGLRASYKNKMIYCRAGFFLYSPLSYKYGKCHTDEVWIVIGICSKCPAWIQYEDIEEVCPEAMWNTNPAVFFSILAFVLLRHLRCKANHWWFSESFWLFRCGLYSVAIWFSCQLSIFSL